MLSSLVFIVQFYAIRRLRTTTATKRIIAIGRAQWWRHQRGESRQPRGASVEWRHHRRLRLLVGVVEFLGGLSDPAAATAARCGKPRRVLLERRSDDVRPPRLRDVGRCRPLRRRRVPGDPVWVLYHTIIPGRRRCHKRCGHDTVSAVLLSVRL